MRHAEISDDTGAKLEMDKLESKLADYDQNSTLNSEYRNAIAMELQHRQVTHCAIVIHVKPVFTEEKV